MDDSLKNSDKIFKPDIYVIKYGKVYKAELLEEHLKIGDIIINKDIFIKLDECLNEITLINKSCSIINDITISNFTFECIYISLIGNYYNSLLNCNKLE